MYFRSFFIPARALPVCMVTKKPSAVWESRPLTKTTKKTLYFYTVLNRVYIFYIYVYILLLYYIFSITMEKTVFRRQKQMKVASEHCSVLLCSVSSRYNSCASFHSFPVKEEIRKIMDCKH